MYTKPMIFPLDADGNLYAIQDEKGDHIGVGTREVCQTLLQLITGSGLMSMPSKPKSRKKRSNDLAASARAA